MYLNYLKQRKQKANKSGFSRWSCVHVEACISKLVGNPVYTTQTQNPTCNRKIYFDLNMHVYNWWTKQRNKSWNKQNKQNQQQIEKKKQNNTLKQRSPKLDFNHCLD